MSNLAIVTQLVLTQTLETSRRNLQDLVVSHDLATAAKLTNEIIYLAANNISGNNPDSEVSLGSVSLFLHIQCDVAGSLEASFTKGATTIVETINKITLRDGSYDSIVLRNLSQTDAMNIKVILA